MINNTGKKAAAIKDLQNCFNYSLLFIVTFPL